MDGLLLPVTTDTSHVGTSDMPPQMNQLASQVASLNLPAVQLNERTRIDISCNSVQSSGEIEAYYENYEPTFYIF